MARLSDDEAVRLSLALGAVEPRRFSPFSAGPAAVKSDAKDAEAARRDEQLHTVQVFFSDATATESLGKALTLDLASYLNRPVRCSVTPPVRPLADGWRFEAPAGSYSWFLDLDAELGAAFADAMIGGDGQAQLGRGRRVRALVEPVVTRMLHAIAVAVGAGAPQSARFTGSIQPHGTPVGGGLCAVAIDQFSWQVGIIVPAGVESSQAPVTASPATDRPIAEEPRPAISQPLGVAETIDAPDEVARSAVASLCAHLEEIIRCKIAGSGPSIAAIDGAELMEMPAAALGLALTAGGNGALVASLDRELVAGLAGGSVSSPVPPSATPGSVVTAAAEAIVRDALRDVAGRLPGIAGEPHRIVRLAENPLPARMSHHIADINLSVGGRSGVLRLLIPSWMLSLTKRPATDEDGHS